MNNWGAAAVGCETIRSDRRWTLSRRGSARQHSLYQL